MAYKSSYPKGSEWRKWDLHIHTPKSIMFQDYGGDTAAAWNAFIEKLASLPSEIKVIAITDYLFLDGYEYLLTRRSEIPNIELIIPNIEFRLNTFSGTANNVKRHNFHVLFDPSLDVATIKEQLLNCLSTAYLIETKDEWHQTPTHKSLIELGKKIKAAAPLENSIHNNSDLEVGSFNITYDRDDILELLKKSPFEGKYVTAMGYSEWDQSRWDQSAAEKRDLINHCDFCLTAQTDPSEINLNHEDLINNKLNSLILQSSDSHKIQDIGTSILWIKADPTFEGLKQVLNEPDARVFMGNNPPSLKVDHKVISKISIPTSNNWFHEGFELLLNRDLVTIIGGRGSGKSALAELIAYGAGSKDENENAFLKKATKHRESIKGTRIILMWGDGSETSFSVGELDEDYGLVQYLPQGAVEELCSPQNSEKLQNQIENVIFQALDDTEKMGASDFEELKAIVLGSYYQEKEEMISTMKTLNRKIYSLTTLGKTLPEKKKQFEDKKAELDRLTKSLPKLPDEDKKGQDELSKLNSHKSKLEAKIIQLRSSLGKISELETRAKIFKSTISKYYDDIAPLLLELGVEPEYFEVKMNESAIDEILQFKSKEINSQITVLREGPAAEIQEILVGKIEEETFKNLTETNKQIEEKQKLTKAFESEKLKYQQQKKMILSTETAIKALEAEIIKLNTEIEPERIKLRKERNELYKSFFKFIKLQKEEIKNLYKPLESSLLSGSETDRKLTFEAKINYKLDKHVQEGLNIIDRSRKGYFREQDNLKRVLNQFWNECVKFDFDEGIIQSELIKVYEYFTKYDGIDIQVEDQIKDGFTTEDLNNWIFNFDAFEIISSIKFDETDLYLLSPGQKGIILLILYLEIDKADTRPLIIDQPEENLDNLSIYKDLITYFRDRKMYRQIIMVTHNPNLVVNTDSEQIIIANYDGKRKPRIEYISGSLEDQAKKLSDPSFKDTEDGIIEQVCNILEGGVIAVNGRIKKYRISNKSKI